MAIILPISTAVLCVASFFLMLRDMSDHKELFQSDKEIKENAKLLSNSAIVYSSLMFVITVAASFLFCTIYTTPETTVIIIAKANSTRPTQFRIV